MIRRKPLTRKKPWTTRNKPLKPGTKRMRTGPSTPQATPAQRARWDRMTARGCVACEINATEGRPTLRPFAPKLDIHHFTNGARRLGHDETVCLCQFHHKGDWWPFENAGYSQMQAIYGPAYHRAKRVFIAAYGSDAELLEFQNSIIAEGAQ